MVNVKCIDTWYEVSITDFVENFDKYSKYCNEVYIQIYNNWHNLDLNKLKQVLK